MDKAQWKVVPVTPTEEMVEAACDSAVLPITQWKRMSAIYAALLAHLRTKP